MEVNFWPIALAVLGAAIEVVQAYPPLQRRLGFAYWAADLVALAVTHSVGRLSAALFTLSQPVDKAWRN